MGDVGDGGQKKDGEFQEASFFGLSPSDTSLAIALHHHRIGEGGSMDSLIRYMQAVEGTEVTYEDINRLVEAGVLAMPEEGRYSFTPLYGDLLNIMSWESYPEKQYPAVNPPQTVGFGTVFYFPKESGLIGYPGLWVITQVTIGSQGNVVAFNGDPILYEKGSYVVKFDAAGTVPIGSAIFLGEISLVTVLHMSENRHKSQYASPMPADLIGAYVDQAQRPRIENPHIDKGIKIAIAS